MSIHQPSSADEAIQWITRLHPLGGTHVGPSQDPRVLEPAFAAGKRSPEYVWATIAEGEVQAVIAGLAAPQGVVLDVFLGNARGVAQALPVATEALSYAGEVMAAVSVDNEHTLRSDALREVREEFATQGWRDMVTRAHYDVDAESVNSDVQFSDVHLLQLASPDDDRLVTIHREIISQTLDVHDRLLVAERGLEGAAAKTLEEMLEADPWEAIRLLVSPQGETLGYCSWVVLQQSKGYLNYVGVKPEARGRSIGAEAVRQAAVAMKHEGATTLIADTDTTNLPMIRVFTRNGWQPSSLRWDLTLTPTTTETPNSRN